MYFLNENIFLSYFNITSLIYNFENFPILIIIFLFDFRYYSDSIFNIGFLYSFYIFILFSVIRKDYIFKLNLTLYIYIYMYIIVA